MSDTLAGLGSYGGTIYGGSYRGNAFYSVNTATGALTGRGPVARVRITEAGRQALAEHEPSNLDTNS